MFDKLIKEVKRLEQGIQVQVNIPVDDDRYLDRRCPASECRADFKVFFDDWKLKVSDERVYCPVCRREAASGEWNTSEQAAYLADQARAHVQTAIGKAIKEDARRFNSRQRPGFIQLSMSYRPGAESLIIPIDAAKAMQQKFVCEVCDCHYAAIGTAFFCPACGHDSAIVMFDQTIASIEQTIANIESIRKTVASDYGDDVAQNSVRLILEQSFTGLVSSFQYLSEELFKRTPKSVGIKVRKNVFQSLSEASDLWREATGKGYNDLLSVGELTELGALFQKRHLIAHRNGIVDQEYVDKSGDRMHRPGQRLVIQYGAVLRLADLLTKLGAQRQYVKLCVKVWSRVR